jgi:hypothetical protein
MIESRPVGVYGEGKSSRCSNCRAGTWRPSFPPVEDVKPIYGDFREGDVQRLPADIDLGRPSALVSDPAIVWPKLWRRRCVGTRLRHLQPTDSDRHTPLCGRTDHEEH